MSKFQTTPDRRANLVKLARFLFTEPIEPSRFDMNAYFANPWEQMGRRRDYGSECVKVQACEPECATAGCAVGWGPVAGVPPLPKETWSQYCQRCFINDIEHEDEWSWCFHSDWNETDNTPAGAAKRIVWLLVRGLPDWPYEQLRDEVPLCYADWEPDESDWTLAAQDPVEAA